MELKWLNRTVTIRRCKDHSAWDYEARGRRVGGEIPTRFSIETVSEYRLIPPPLPRVHARIASPECGIDLATFR